MRLRQRDILEVPKEVFGMNFRRLRKAKGLSQSELARQATGKSHASISHIETGERDIRRMGIHTLGKFAQAFGCTITEFLDILAGNKVAVCPQCKGKGVLTEMLAQEPKKK